LPNAPIAKRAARYNRPAIMTRRAESCLLQAATAI